MILGESAMLEAARRLLRTYCRRGDWSDLYLANSAAFCLTLSLLDGIGLKTNHLRLGERVRSFLLHPVKDSRCLYVSLKRRSGSLPVSMWMGAMPL